MPTNFSLIFGLALFVNVAVTFRSSGYWTRWCGKSNKVGDAAIDQGDVVRHRQLLQRYLVVYLLATLSDWLQGPYVYALYSAYEYSQHDIAVLFVAGFGSSMVFGSFVGGMSDWGGRRLFVIVYAVIYASSCVTKHFSNFHMLMLGRLLGGVATSLLFSVFEAWLIRAHTDAKIPKTFLNKSFSWAAYCNSIIAILAGLLAENAAGLLEMTKMVGSEETKNAIYIGGYISPFDIAFFGLVACGAAAFWLWEENYGESQEAWESNASRSHGKWYDGLQSAFVTTIRNCDILLCGMISSFFEGSMYIFVFMWTPTLRGGLAEGQELPFGVIFATFMVCCMAGSSLFSILVEHIPGETMAVGIFGVASLCMMVIASTYETDTTMAFIAMNVFEVCVGMYFPVMGTMKGGIVPEDKRAAIYNLYRIPLNMIVLLSLLTDLSPKASFGINGAMLVTATLLQGVLRIRRLRGGTRSTLTPSPSKDEAELASLRESMDSSTNSADAKV